MAVLIPLALFYLQEDIDRVSLDFLRGSTRPIGSYLSCKGNVLFESPLLAARKKEGDQIKLLVHFNEKPSTDTRDFLATEGVNLYLDTWIIDYAVVDTTVSKLCFLAGLPGITSIALGE